MPRDGSGIYTRPPGTNAVADTTIESTKYNANVADVEADLNAPRPIIAGGTGATSAAAARTNLKAEVATQQVTNYDTHVWEAGSFWSATDATSPPLAGRPFIGTAALFGSDPTGYITLKVNDIFDTMLPGRTWIREKRAGVWSLWTHEQAGTNTNNNATGGQVGEYNSNSRPSGAASAIAPNAIIDVTAMVLTAGDWDVWGSVTFSANATPSSPITTVMGISTVSAGIPAGPIGRSSAIDQLRTNGSITMFCQTRVSLAATTTIFVAAYMNYIGADGGGAYGEIQGRRVR